MFLGIFCLSAYFHSLFTSARCVVSCLACLLTASRPRDGFSPIVLKFALSHIFRRLTSRLNFLSCSLGIRREETRRDGGHYICYVELHVSEAMTQHVRNAIEMESGLVSDRLSLHLTFFA